MKPLELKLKLGTTQVWKQTDSEVIRMFSFDRPSETFWNGVAAGLRESGWTKKQITEWLKSAGTRLFMDENDHKLYELGLELGRNQICE